MTIIPLGTNGFFPSFGRQTACYAVSLADKLIILDAGSGLFRLAEPEGKKLLATSKEVLIFLSHYHLDHTFGFYAAFKLLKGKRVSVYAQEGRQVFWDLVSLKHFPINYDKEYGNFVWKSLQPGFNKVSDFQVTVRKQFHRGEGSLAFRFKFQDRELAYVTDSEPNEDCLDFVKDVDLLLMEHYLSGEEIKSERIDDQTVQGHITTIGAARIAKEANVGKLILIHHYPFSDERQLETLLKTARSVFPKTDLARDLLKITF